MTVASNQQVQVFNDENDARLYLAGTWYATYSKQQTSTRTERQFWVDRMVEFGNVQRAFELFMDSLKKDGNLRP